MRPPRYIHRTGLLFFALSCFTLLTTLLFQIFYVICTKLDEYQGPVYRFVYFLQMYALWVVLFLRVYYLFRNSSFALSKLTITLYAAAFIAVPLAIIPTAIVLGFSAGNYLTLPYVALSLCLSTALLITFLAKLLEIVTGLGSDEILIRAATKNTLLALISISFTLLVLLVLMSLRIRHHGSGDYSIAEELVLELVVTVDVISNYLCVFLAYKFFDRRYYQLFGGLDRKFAKCFQKLLTKHLPETEAGSQHGRDSMMMITKQASHRSKPRTILAIVHAESNRPPCQPTETAEKSPSPISPESTLSLQRQYHSMPPPQMVHREVRALPTLKPISSNPVVREKRESLMMSELNAEAILDEISKP